MKLTRASTSGNFNSIIKCITEPLMNYTVAPLIRVHEGNKFIKGRDIVIYMATHHGPFTWNKKYLSSCMSVFDMGRRSIFES